MMGELTRFDPGAWPPVPLRQLQMRLSLLGLYADDTTPLTSSGLRPSATWPSQVEVASYLQVPRGRLSQIMAAERQRWVRDRAMTALRHQIVQEVQAAGGVMTLDELCDALLATRTTALRGYPKISLGTTVYLLDS